MLALGAGKSSLELTVAGLKISDGEAARASSKIMLRGAASVDSSKKPLYILDGKVSSLEYIKSINPKIIESVNVLKKTQLQVFTELKPQMESLSSKLKICQEKN